MLHSFEYRGFQKHRHTPDSDAAAKAIWSEASSAPQYASIKVNVTLVHRLCTASTSTDCYIRLTINDLVFALLLSDAGSIISAASPPAQPCAFTAGGSRSFLLRHCEVPPAKWLAAILQEAKEAPLLYTCGTCRLAALQVLLRSAAAAADPAIALDDVQNTPQRRAIAEDALVADVMERVHLHLQQRRSVML